MIDVTAPSPCGAYLVGMENKATQTAIIVDLTHRLADAQREIARLTSILRLTDTMPFRSDPEDALLESDTRRSMRTHPMAPK